VVVVVVVIMAVAVAVAVATVLMTWNLILMKNQRAQQKLNLREIRKITKMIHCLLQM
jgi:hypothetical protein